MPNISSISRKNTSLNCRPRNKKTSLLVAEEIKTVSAYVTYPEVAYILRCHIHYSYEMALNLTASEQVRLDVDYAAIWAQLGNSIATKKALSLAYLPRLSCTPLFFVSLGARHLANE